MSTKRAFTGRDPAAVVELVAAKPAAAYPIEDGVLLPEKAPGRPAKYPFAALRVGQSFFVAGGTQPVMACRASTFGKHHGGKFVTRKVEGGVRVWRVE